MSRDDTSNPEVGKRLAQELITRDHVQLLTGVILSPVAAAIAPLTAEAKVPLLLNIAAAGVSIPRLSPYVARISFTLWQQCYPIGKWAAEQGWKTAYTAVSDFIPGHDSEAAFTKGFTDGGGKIVGSVRYPAAEPRFRRRSCSASRTPSPMSPSLSVPAGTQATAMMKAVRDLGLREAGINIVSAAGPAARRGAARHGRHAAGPHHRRASIRPRRSGRPTRRFSPPGSENTATQSIPDFFSVDGWDGMAAIFDLIKETKGKFTGDEAMEFLSHWKNPDSPRGPIDDRSAKPATSSRTSISAGREGRAASSPMSSSRRSRWSRTRGRS